MIVKKKNTPESCWRSNQMCFLAEYVKHIHSDLVILTHSASKVYWQNIQKALYAAEMELK